MSASPYIIEVTEENFPALIEASQRVPVLVDFWAEWCQPCQTLLPLLTKLAHEYRGGMVLGKVNTDQEQALANYFQVRSVPTVLVIWQGQIVEQLVGLQPESAYRQIVERFHEPRAEQFQDQIEALWTRGLRNEAVQLIHDALRHEPSTELKTLLAEKLLQMDRAAEARQVLQSLPPEQQAQPPASAMLAQLQFADLIVGAAERSFLEKQVKAHPTNSTARRQLAARLVLIGEYQLALEQFLELMSRDPQFADGAGRQGLLAVFDILGAEHPLVTTYRRRMFSLLH